VGKSTTTPLALHPHRGGPLLGEGRGVEDEHGVVAADRGGDLADQFTDQRSVLPVDLSEEPLDDLAVEVVTVGDGLGFFRSTSESSPAM
jgi:hypothetical protein